MLALVAPLALSASGAAALTRTITTIYAYNADGAPTAVVVDGVTTYLTYDNFTPDAGAPTTGTISAGDGNLLGRGARPGETGQFTYDVRDRLTGCSAAGQSVAYAYHPASLMKSSTLAAGDALQFYYDTAAAPRMVNTTQPSSGAAASFLGPLRYLSDGSEQILFTPRKDVAGLYDATQQTLVPYHYEPYGASTDPATPARQHVSTSALGPSQYDLSANPFQYAGEYRDPTCALYYLRARWYLAEHQTFLSRDPVDPLHRYGYTGGDPVGRVDPSGLRSQAAGFTDDVDKIVHTLAPGHVLPWVEPALPVVGQALGGIQLVGLLPSFFHRPTTQGYVTLGFLATSMVAEVPEELSHGLDRFFLLTPHFAFETRLATDAALGAAQTLAQSSTRGPFHGRIDVAALGQGLETTTAGIVNARLAGGIGYRPFSRTSDDVADDLATYFTGQPNSMLVYRAREALPDGRVRYTSPLLEALHGGWYHESTFGITKTAALYSEIVEGTDRLGSTMLAAPWRLTGETLRETAASRQLSGDPPVEYALAGIVDDTRANRATLLGLPLPDRLSSASHFNSFALPAIADDGPRLTGVGRASQRSAVAIRRSLGLR